MYSIIICKNDHKQELAKTDQKTATSKTWTWTLDPGLKNLDPEEPGPWKTWETAGYGKMIRRPHL